MTIELFDPTKNYAAAQGHLTYRGGPLLQHARLVGVFVDDFALTAEMAAFLDWYGTSSLVTELAEYNITGPVTHYGDVHLSLSPVPTPNPPPHPVPPPNPPPVPAPHPRTKCPPGCRSVHHAPQPPTNDRPLPDWDWDDMEPWRTLAQLPFDEAHKAIVLEYAASVLWQVLERVNTCGGKRYDPLEIHGDVAWSYVFELTTGGRRHPFDSLEQLEQALITAGVRNLRRHYDPSYDEEIEGLT